MSGAVLGVTLLAGMATLGASIFIVKGDNKELLERKADEEFAKSKLPYDFSLNRDGLERLRNLKGALLLQAIKDPRMDSDRISRMTEAEFEELAKSSEEVPMILKDSPEVKMRDLVERLFVVLKAGKGGMASGKVIAWVLMIHRDGLTLLDGDVKLNFSEAAAALIEMYNDATFRFRDRCRVALTDCINKKTQDVARRVVENDAFLRVFPDNRAMAKLMRSMEGKSSTQLANMEVVKRLMFDEQDLRDLMGDGLPSSVTKFMKDFYMPRYSTRLDVVRSYSGITFAAKVGRSGAHVDGAGNVDDDRVVSVAGGNVTETNEVTLAAPPPLHPLTMKTKMVVKRAFDFMDTIDITVSRQA